MLLAIAMWSTLVGCFTVESAVNTDKDILVSKWEKQIAEKANAMKEIPPDSSSPLLDDINAYYKSMLDTMASFSEEDANSPDSIVPPFFYSQNHARSAPPFLPEKSLHTQSARQDHGLKVIPARYMVMFQSTATVDNLTRTITFMEELTQTTGKKMRATDFTVFEHAAKGFTATLNSAALHAVSTVLF